MGKELKFNYTKYFLKCLKLYDYDLYNRLIKLDLFCKLMNIEVDNIRLLLSYRIYRYDLAIKFDAFKNSQSHPIIDIILDRFDYNYISSHDTILLLTFSNHLWNMPILNMELTKLYNEYGKWQ
jgi:hypothetical protein